MSQGEVLLHVPEKWQRNPTSKEIPMVYQLKAQIHSDPIFFDPLKNILEKYHLNFESMNIHQKTSINMHGMVGMARWPRQAQGGSGFLGDEHGLVMTGDDDWLVLVGGLEHFFDFPYLRHIHLN